MRDKRHYVSLAVRIARRGNAFRPAYLFKPCVMKRARDDSAPAHQARCLIPNGIQPPCGTILSIQRAARRHQTACAAVHSASNSSEPSRFGMRRGEGGRCGRGGTILATGLWSANKPRGRIFFQPLAVFDETSGLGRTLGVKSGESNFTQPGTLGHWIDMRFLHVAPPRKFSRWRRRMVLGRAGAMDTDHCYLAFAGHTNRMADSHSLLRPSASHRS